MMIIGAGMAGLIAGHYFSRQTPVIYEAQKSLPNNHEALLRFRTDKVSRLTGVDFKKVEVRKSILCEGRYHSECNPYLANMYSRKVTDEVLGRSIWNTDPADRFIAPPDFISRAAADLRISYSSGVDDMDFIKLHPGPVISTIPMPVLMDLVDWKDRPRFKWKPIWSVQVEIIDPFIDVYQTIHYPDHGCPYYRASITGNKLIIECLDQPDNVSKMLYNVARDFGIHPCAFASEPTPKYQEYGKIVSHDPDMCQDFLYAMTREYGVYSLGRFATWRQLLMDDVVDDCVVIERLIKAEARRSGYHDSLRLVKASISHA